MEIEALVNLLGEHGVWGLILFVAIYILLNSKFTIEYPRKSKHHD